MLQKNQGLQGPCNDRILNLIGSTSSVSQTAVGILQDGVGEKTLNFFLIEPGELQVKLKHHDFKFSLGISMEILRRLKCRSWIHISNQSRGPASFLMTGLPCFQICIDRFMMNRWFTFPCAVLEQAKIILYQYQSSLR